MIFKLSENAPFTAFKLESMLEILSFNAEAAPESLVTEEKILDTISLTLLTAEAAVAVAMVTTCNPSWESPWKTSAPLDVLVRTVSKVADTTAASALIASITGLLVVAMVATTTAVIASAILTNSKPAARRSTRITVNVLLTVLSITVDLMYSLKPTSINRLVACTTPLTALWTRPVTMGPRTSVKWVTDSEMAEKIAFAALSMKANVSVVIIFWLVTCEAACVVVVEEVDKMELTFERVPGAWLASLLTTIVNPLILLLNFVGNPAEADIIVLSVTINWGTFWVKTSATVPVKVSTVVPSVPTTLREPPKAPTIFPVILLTRFPINGSAL